MTRLFSGALWIAAIYVVVSLVWIAVSDRVVESIATDAAALSWMQSVKGSVFVVTTGLVLYLLISLYSSRIRQRNRDLEDAESAVRLLFSTSQTAEALIDPKTGRIHSVNEQAKRLFGVERSAVPGRDLADFVLVVPGPNGGTVEHDVAAAMEGSRDTVDWCIRQPSGDAIACQVYLTPIAQFGTMLIRATFVDTDAEKRRKMVLATLGEGLAPKLGVDFLGQLTRNLAVLLEAKHVLVAQLPTNSAGHVSALAFTGATKTINLEHYRVRGTPFETAIETGRCCFEDDVCVAYPGARDLADLGVRGFAARRIDGPNGEPLGLLVVMNDEPLGSVRQTDEVLDLVVERTAAELGRVKADTERRNSEIRFRSLIDEASQGIVVHDNMRPIYANPAFARMFGFDSPDEICALDSIEVLFDPPELERLRELAVRRAKGEMGDEVPDEYEFDGRDRNGNKKRIRNRVVRVPWNGKYVICANMFDITERNRLEREVEENREFLRVMLDSIEDGIVACDAEGELKLFNAATMDFHGLPAEPLPASEWSEHYSLYEADGVTPMATDDIPLFRAMNGERVINQLMAIRPNNDEIRFVRATGQALINAEGKSLGAVVSMHDVTAEREAEEMIRRSQRMDAVGQLTGGIAHDFNNLLGIIIGNLDFLKRLPSANPKTEKYVETAISATERAAALTARLLDFARQDADSKSGAATNVNETIATLEHILTKSLTQSIDVSFRLDDEVWLTEIDAGDLGDVILNLSLNARDAMPCGGRLIIETANCTIDDRKFAQAGDIATGDYVVIRVSDTGEGMPEETVKRAFEPFFTTKAGGRGSGLGLSMVYAFAKRSRGHVGIESEPGRGTTVTLLLPRLAAAMSSGQTALSKADAEELPGGSETVLIVDDEEELLEIASECLQSLGYRSLVASDGASALRRFDEHPEIDLVVSDVIMPGGMDGFQLARELRARRPATKILITTGYSGQRTAEREGENEIQETILAKPYDRDKLANAVRQVIDAESVPATAQSRAGQTVAIGAV